MRKHKLTVGVDLGKVGMEELTELGGLGSVSDRGWHEKEDDLFIINKKINLKMILFT